MKRKWSKVVSKIVKYQRIWKMMSLSSLIIDPIWIDVSITFYIESHSIQYTTIFIVYVSTGGRDNWQWVVLSFISVTTLVQLSSGRTEGDLWALMMTVMDYATMTTTGNTKAKPSKPIQQSKQFMYKGIFDDRKH